MRSCHSKVIHIVSSQHHTSYSTAKHGEFERNECTAGV